MTLPPLSRAPEAPPLLLRLTRKAKAQLWWQHLWPRLVLALALTALMTMLVLSGVMAGWPHSLRWPVLAGLAAATVALWVWAFWLPTPTDRAALDLIEKAGHGAALSALSDHAVNGDETIAAALWRAHQARLVPMLARVRLGLPKTDMARRDPYALRFLVLLLFVPFLVSQWSHLGTQWRDMLRPDAMAPTTYRLDAFVTPPAYTMRAPVMLARGQAGSLRVPQGSIVTIRLAGAEPRITASERLVQLPAPEGESAWQWRLDGDGTLGLSLPDRQEHYAFAVTADQPPLLRIEGEPEADSRNALAFRYSAEDDYGVKEIEARFTVAERDMARALAPPPDFAVSLPQQRLRSGTYPASKDLLAHPWAGLSVKMQLVGHDDAGQEGRSQSVDVTLPERMFTNPLAQVLVDQRRDLALDAGAKPRVLRVFEAWMTAPQLLRTPTAHYLLLTMLEARLKKAATAAELREFLDTLWAYANAIEDGDVSAAERDVRAAAEALREAISRGAPPDEVARLSKELRDAMNRLNSEMAAQARRNGGQKQAQKPPPGTKVIRQRDIQALLDRIEELNRQGATEQAERLMQELQQMLRDMETARQNGQMYSEEGEAGEDALKGLSDMIRRQQQLRDQTFKRDQQQRNRSRPPQKGDEAPSDGELQERQEGLSKDLDQLSQELGENGNDGDSDEGQQGRQGSPRAGEGGGPPSGRGQQREGGQGQQGQGQSGEESPGRGLGQARRAMREAQDALGRGDRQGALDAQNRAIRGLQRGAQALAQQQQQQGQGQGQQSRSGEGQGSEGDDPLGRPGRRRDFGDGMTTRVPGAGENAAQRAQRLLDELRRRFGETSRPALELDYIDRLLKGIGP